jgi:hypothetical protein
MARKIKPIKARGVFKRRLLFTMGLRRVRLFCTKCDKYIPGEMEWHCLHCNYDNYSTRVYSFLNKCKQCKRTAQAVICPHCEELNYLDKYMVGTHPASKIKVSDAVQRREAIIQKKRVKQWEEREEMEHKIQIARMNADLKRMEAAAIPDNPMAEELEAEWQKRKLREVGVDTIVERELKANAERWKDNLDKRDKFDAAVRSWAEDKALSSS